MPTDSPKEHPVADNPAMDRRAQLAALAGVDPATESAEVAVDVTARARWARACNNGHPSAAWSTGEQLAVALVLNDHQHLADRGYTVAEAAQRVAGGMYFPPADLDTWLNEIRTRCQSPRDAADGW